MNKSLFVCIAFHYDPNRLQYLYRVIDNLLHYDCPVTIVVDTNVNDLVIDRPVIVYPHTDLAHPFHLTWQHRKHINENIDKYDVFYYTEDDILLPYNNYLNYLENFEMLWPNEVPSFIRIENFNGEQFVTDIVEPQHVHCVLKKQNKLFYQLNPPNNYNGFWIMPQPELKRTLMSIFLREHESREHASSYVAWELCKPTIIEIKHNVVSEKCYAYHLPANYAKSSESKHGKLNPKNIFL